MALSDRKITEEMEVPREILLYPSLMASFFYLSRKDGLKDGFESLRGAYAEIGTKLASLSREFRHIKVVVDENNSNLLSIVYV
jgi:hypothetical protein